MRLVYLTPQTEEEMAPFVPWLSVLLETFPASQRIPLSEREAFILGHVGYLTVPFLSDDLESLPLGCFLVELSKKSAEIHGITRPDLKELIGRAAGPVIASVGKKMLEVIFLDHEKSVAVAKVPTDSRGGLGFLRRWGFSPMRDANTGVKMDKGRRVYVLPRQKFLEKYCKGVC